MSNGMVRISYYTSQSFKERIKDIAKINKKSVSSVVDELLEMAFARQERKLVKLDIDETKNKLGILQNTINALNDNIVQMSSRLDSHLKNTSAELDKTIQELIKELDEILSKSKTTEEKHYALLDEQIYRLQIIAFNIYRLHFADEIEMKKAVKQCLKEVKEKVTQFKQDNTMRAV